MPPPLAVPTVVAMTPVSDLLQLPQNERLTMPAVRFLPEAVEDLLETQRCTAARIPGAGSSAPERSAAGRGRVGGTQRQWSVVAAGASGGQQNGSHGSQTATHA